MVNGEFPLPLSVPALTRCPPLPPTAPSLGGPQTHPPKVGAGPLSPKYLLAPRLMPCPVPTGSSPETVDATGDTGGHWEATVGPWGTTKPYARDAVTEGEGGGQPPGGGGGPGTCRVQDRYCVVKGYLVAAVFGPLLMLVAAVHVATRDKATEAVPGGQSGV